MDIEPKKSPLEEIVQPFIDLVHAPRALWGINISYTLEGFAYFGVLGLLALYFSNYIFAGSEHPNELAHTMVMVLTAGITISQLVFGYIPDKYGVRFALIASFCLLLVGRVFISGAPEWSDFHLDGLWTKVHIITMVGIMFIVAGYGMYQPAAYTAVRQFTNPKTAAMGYAMLYALMNLGGSLVMLTFIVRTEDYMDLGFIGTFWMYALATVVGLLSTIFILSKKTVADTIAKEKEKTKEILEIQKKENPDKEEQKNDTSLETNGEKRWVPFHMWVLFFGTLIAIFYRVPTERYINIQINYLAMAGVSLLWVLLVAIPLTGKKLANHPLANAKFFFFIFALIPVQTLFTYNWFVLPSYISRSFADGWIGKYFEIGSNANPIMIFIAVPIITALTQKTNVYKMMIWGTLIMAAPAFLLAIGPYWWTLYGYLLIMTIGEAMWQPRFLQYAAEIAPEGKTGQYIGVAQLPWFLTKLLVPALYSGWMVDKYCPESGDMNTQFMWLIFACIAMASPILLILAKGWIGKDIK